MSKRIRLYHYFLENWLKLLDEARIVKSEYPSNLHFPDLEKTTAVGDTHVAMAHIDYSIITITVLIRRGKKQYNHWIVCDFLDENIDEKSLDSAIVWVKNGLNGWITDTPNGFGKGPKNRAYGITGVFFDGGAK